MHAFRIGKLSKVILECSIVLMPYDRMYKCITVLWYKVIIYLFKKLI